jgi:EAL domain-containing protein (putative c-di-GMP-specific phosphodiesterase class I)
MRRQAVERLELEAELKRGIERGEFEIHYQPIVSLPEKNIKGLEALLRWQHSKRGLVPPMEFVPIAEEIGFIEELGEWVLDHACRQVRAWQREYPGCASLFISVNVSSKQFRDPRLLERVKGCLVRSGLEGRFLKLEITESAIMSEPRMAALTLEQLRDLGVHISLDDFGTGYSSLSYLQSFKIDTLKIDQSFVARMGDAGESAEIVRTIVNLAHNLGMEVTAEGIENVSQHSQLHAIACESGQGFLYSHPLPEDCVPALLDLQCRANLAAPVAEDGTNRAQTKTQIDMEPALVNR